MPPGSTISGGDAEVQGIDPSDAQLTFARTRSDAGTAQFHRGDATALPFPDSTFDGDA